MIIRMSAELLRNLTSTFEPGSGMPSWSWYPGAGEAERTVTTPPSHDARTLPPADVKRASADAPFDGAGGVVRAGVVDRAGPDPMLGPAAAGPAPVGPSRSTTM